MNKKVIIITINYNQSQMTIECVDSVLESTYDNYSVCLIDNGSDEDDYSKLIEAFNMVPKVNILRIEKNCGYVGGVNHGLKNALTANPDYFLIMNNDTIIDKYAVSYLVESAIRNNNNAIISGKTLHFDKPDIIQNVGGVFKNKIFLIQEYLYSNEKDSGQCESEEERDMLDDILWIIPKNIFQNIGYYSGDFFLYAEQGDYARRAVNKGHKLLICPKAKIWHKGSVSSGNAVRFAPHVNFWRNQGGIIYRAKHLNTFIFWVYVLKLLAKLSIRFIFSFFRKTENSKSLFAGIIGVLDGALWKLNNRQNNGHNPFI